MSPDRGGIGGFRAGEIPIQQRDGFRVGHGRLRDLGYGGIPNVSRPMIVIGTARGVEIRRIETGLRLGVGLDPAANIGMFGNASTLLLPRPPEYGYSRVRARRASCFSHTTWPRAQTARLYASNSGLSCREQRPAPLLSSHGTAGSRPQLGDRLLSPTSGSTCEGQRGRPGFAIRTVADVVGLSRVAPGTQYLGADGACHTTAAACGSVRSHHGQRRAGSELRGPPLNLAVIRGHGECDEWWVAPRIHGRRCLAVTGSGPRIKSSGSTVSGIHRRPATRTVAST